MMLRKMICRGFDRQDPQNDDFRFKISDECLLKISLSMDVSTYIARQQTKYISHIIG